MPIVDKVKRKEYNRQQYLLNKEKNKCEHQRRKYQCKECNGSQICVHNKIKTRCKECGGNEFCEHGKRKTICKECGGVSICEHNRVR